MFTWITGVISREGAWGVFLLMTLENIFPPLPSELVMPMAGYVAGRTGGSLVAVIVAGTAGSAVGAVAWYFAGRWIGLSRLEGWSRRFGRWLLFSPAELERAQAWFRRWGLLAVLAGRTLPGVRGVICIPAGLTGMPFLPFFLASTIGSLIWTTLLAFAGRLLAAHYAAVQHWLNPVTSAFTVACAAGYLLRVLTYGRRQRR